MSILSKQDFAMILDAIDGNIAHIMETSTLEEDRFREEIEMWQDFKIKIVRLQATMEGRLYSWCNKRDAD
jgi:hypothetical protein